MQKPMVTKPRCLSLLRARFSEMLTAALGFGPHKSKLFLMGLLSCMDVLLGRPIGEILQDIPLGAEPKAALLGERNFHREIFDLVLSYEKTGWAAIFELAARLGMNPAQMSQIYAECVVWVDVAFER
jgi:EAL and modified HD-GYP domain-containing signal transduction protein